MKMTFTVCFLIFTFQIYSQESALFDRNFHNRVNSKNSQNRREYKIRDSIVEIKDTNENGLFRTGEFFGFTDLVNLDEYIWYNASHHYDKSTEVQVKNRKGTVKYFDRKGLLEREELFIEDKVKVIQVWNNGKPGLVNGSGTIVYDYDEVRGEKEIKIFKDSLEISDYVVRNQKNDTIYLKTETNAYPKYGLKTFYQDIASKVNYPGFANSMGITKKITIEFVVDERGKLVDFVPLNSKSLRFEENTIETLEQMPDWIPAVINGKVVKTRFRIPITFGG